MDALSPLAQRALVLRRVLARRCPQCGQGRIFRAYARLHGACEHCGLVYRREQGAQTGSMYLTAAVNQVFAAALIAAVWLLTDWGTGTMLAVALPLVAGFCYWFLPRGMALWVLVEYLTDLANGSVQGEDELELDG